MNGPEVFAAIQSSLQTLMIGYLPEFQRFGYSMFVSFATIMIAWRGIGMMFTGHHDGLQDQIFSFVKLLLFISIGYAFIAFYSVPIPGIGSSFVGLILNQTQYFSNVLDASTVTNVYTHLNTLFNSIIPPGPFQVTAALVYLVMYIMLTAAKILSIAVVAFGLIASAVCALLGPLFVSFFIVPKLDYLFWGWFKAFLQYSFIPVVCYAYFMVFERFLFNVTTTIPAGITVDLYPTYGVQVVVITGVFLFGVLYIPSLTASIFSGSGAQSVVDKLIR